MSPAPTVGTRRRPRVGPGGARLRSRRRAPRRSRPGAGRAPTRRRSAASWSGFRGLCQEVLAAGHQQVEPAEGRHRGRTQRRQRQRADLTPSAAGGAASPAGWQRARTADRRQLASPRSRTSSATGATRMPAPIGQPARRRIGHHAARARAVAPGGSAVAEGGGRIRVGRLDRDRSCRSSSSPAWPRARAPPR